MKNIVILGAGPCGLSAAWELAGKGYDVTVIEKGSGVGGLCRSVSHKGFTFDLGGHRFISGDQELISRVSALMGDELLLRNRKSVIFLGNKTFQYPLSLKDVLCKMDPMVSIGACFDFISSFLSGSLKKMFNTTGSSGSGSREQDISFEDWTISRFGKTLYEIFFKTFTEKFWGIRAGDLSSDWAAQRIPVQKFHHLIQEVLGVKRKHEAYAKQYYYPKNGIGQIFEYMAEDITKKGGVVRLNAKAEEVHVEGDAVKGITFTENGNRKSIDCDILISTIPVTELLSGIRPVAEPGLTGYKELKYRSVRFLNILINKEKISDNTWIYVPEDKYLMTRIQEPKARSPFNAPGGKTSIMLEVPCDHGDRVWNADDKDIFDRSVSDLFSLGIDIKDSVIDYFSTRAQHAYPVYRSGYKKLVTDALEYLDRYNNLFTAGRQGLFRYLFMDQAMSMGITIAETIIDDSANTGFDNTIGLEKELIEEKAVCGQMHEVK